MYIYSYYLDENENACARTYCVTVDTLVRNYGATNVAPTQTNHTSRQRGGPISKHINGLGRNKNLITGPETKNGCAGECQQQFTAMLCRANAK
jgi:hypothetical protein